MTIQFELAPHQKAFVESEVRSGRYRTEEDVLREAVDLMASRREVDRKLQELRDAIQVGLDESERDELVEETGPQILARLRAAG